MKETQNIEQTVTTLFSTIGIPFSIKDRTVHLPTRKYDLVLFESEHFKKKFLVDNILGCKFLFECEEPELLKPAIITFVKKRKNINRKNFINFCKLELGMNVDVIWKFNSLKNKQI